MPAGDALRGIDKGVAQAAGAFYIVPLRQAGEQRRDDAGLARGFGTVDDDVAAGDCVGLGEEGFGELKHCGGGEMGRGGCYLEQGGQGADLALPAGEGLQEGREEELVGELEQGRHGPSLLLRGEDRGCALSMTCLGR